MVTYRTQVSLVMDDANPENTVTNTWHCLGVDVGDATDFAIAVRAIYNGVLSYLSPLLAQNGHGIKVYDLEDPEPRAPVIEYSWNLTGNPGGTPMPPEVAICLSYQAAKISGVPQARRRGRVFIGPLNTSAMGTDGRPATAFINALVGAADALKDPAGAPDWDWSTWSSFDPTVSTVIDNGWVDNEFDTQRRRGRKYTTRTTFT
jgi:hypothetical protein